MATDVILPKLGFAMNEGKIAEWLVADGQPVAVGQLLFVLEADKSTNEIEAPASGRLRILQPVGGTHEVGTVIGVIE